MSQPEQKPGRSKQDYATPPVFIEAVKHRLGIDAFTFDFAADESNAKAPFWWDEQINALAQPVEQWADRCRDGWGWLNPPFALIGPWAKRCAEVAAQTDGKIAFLVPAAVGANWYRDHVHRAHARVLFLNGRIPFMPDKPKWLYPKDCILVLYGLGNQWSDVWTWRESTRKVA